MQVVFGDRWYLGTGGIWGQVVFGDRWFLGTGSLWVQVVFGHRWSLGVGDLFIQGHTARNDNPCRAGGTGQAGPAMAGPLSQLDGPCDSCKTGVKKSRGT